MPVTVTTKGFLVGQVEKTGWESAGGKWSLK